MKRIIFYVLLLMLSTTVPINAQFYTEGDTLYVWATQGIKGVDDKGAFIDLPFGARLHLSEYLSDEVQEVCLLQSKLKEQSFCVKSNWCTVHWKGQRLKIEDVYLSPIEPFNLEKPYTFFNHFAESGQFGKVLSDSIHQHDAWQSYRHVRSDKGFQGYEFIETDSAYHFELVFSVMTLRELFLIANAIYPNSTKLLNRIVQEEKDNFWGKEKQLSITVEDIRLNELHLKQHYGFAVLTLKGAYD
jgi:hypothetical protein